MKKTKREEGAQDTKQKQIKPKKPSLSKALDIEENLRLCKKFELSDRVIFSQNLGNLVAIEIKKNPGLTVHKLFKQSFGSSAESLYKKRKSLITLPKETMPQGPSRSNLRSKARDYLLILEALSKIKKDYSQESKLVLKKKLILRLVENSSFDDQRKIKDRVYDEQLTHLKDVLTKIVDRVTDEVDLDHLLVWCENYNPMNAPTVERRGANTSAPSVKIADLFLPIRADVAEITFTKDEIGNLDETGDEEIARLIRKRLIKDDTDPPWKASDYIFDDNDIIDGKRKRSINQLFPELEFSNTYFSYYVKSSIFLEIRHNKWSDRWEPIITWRSDEADSPFDTQQKSYDYNNLYYSHARHKTMLIAQIWDYNNYLTAAKEPYWSAWKESPDIITYQLFLAKSGDIKFYLEELGGILFQDGSSFADGDSNYGNMDTYSFLLHPAKGDLENKYKIDISFSEYMSDEFSMSPEDSFAHKILTNLAYASEEDRIDNLLLKDAKQKNKVFKELEKNKKEEYLSAIARFENDQLKG